MKKKKLRSLILAGLLALTLAIPVFAAYTKYITVEPGVNIFIDDKRLNPKDANGNSVEVFIYNGTTYLPARAISEALGQVVQWDGDTNSVYIGKHTGEKPAVWLTDLDCFMRDDIEDRETTKDNLGVEHKHCLSLLYDPYLRSSRGSIRYKLNGQFAHLSGAFYQLYKYRSYNYGTTLEIYGDGELLWQGTVRGGIDPVNIDIDVSNIIELEMCIRNGDYEVHAAVGDLGLWT